MRQQTEFGEIPVDWQVKKIIDIKSDDKRAIAMGPFGSNIKADNFVPSGVPVIRGTNMNYAKYVDGNFVYLTDEKADELIGSNCKPDDLVFTHRGTIGQVALIPHNKYSRYVISQSGMKLTVNQSIVNSEFLFYFFKSDYGQYQILKYEAQVGVPSISNPLTSLKEMNVPVPLLTEQKAIVSVLSSLDNKIDLLHRQNKTLESMAESLFRQWFVEEIQDDYSDITIETVIETTSGGTPSRKLMEYYQNGNTFWVKSKELNGLFINSTEEKITDEAIKNSSAKLLPKHSILIAMYGATVGEYAVISKPMSCNQAICALKPNDNYPYTYIFMYVKTQKDELINQAVGSAQQNISQALIKKMKVSSNLGLINKYHNTVLHMFEKIEENSKQIQTLEKLRDTLLPKLMSGEVRVNYTPEEIKQ
ncbi:restriction endonuclease subunit S [Providencia alcalifaciens]